MDPVYSKSNIDGLTHDVHVMYHGTDDFNVLSILENGFSLSATPRRGRMFGTGVYASTDFAKTATYGNVTLKLLVYTGKVSVYYVIWFSDFSLFVCQKYIKVRARASALDRVIGPPQGLGDTEGVRRLRRD